MSVAFRRDGDEEHLEPRFEVPIPPGPNMVTAAGLAQIETRIAQLQALLPSLAGETEIAAAKRDLRYWRARLATAEVQPAPACDVVAIGCRVHFTLHGKPRAIGIVGHDEADPAQDRLAFTAPLARALLGAEVGEVVDFHGAEDAIEVLEIAPL